MANENNSRNRWNLIFLFNIWLLGLASVPGQAQTQAIFSYATLYDENIWRTYNSPGDWVHQFQLDLSHTVPVQSAGLNFRYQGDLNLFYENSAANFYFHGAGLELRLNISENWRLTSGGELQWRHNRPDYQLYDYTQGAIFVRSNWKRGASFPLQLDYQYRNRRLAELSTFSYHEQLGWLRFNKFFPSKTTLILECGYGVKSFTQSSPVAEIVLSAPGYRSGWGRGRSQSRHEWLPADTALVAYNLMTPIVNQWLLRVRLAQSVAARTGLSLEYTRRFQPSANTRYLTGQAYTYAPGDELYDDPYSYSSQTWSGILRHIFPHAFELKCTLSTEAKTYRYQLLTLNPVHTKSPEILRQDQPRQMELVITKKVPTPRIVKQLAFNLTFSYLKNKSNAPYFDYQTRWISLGIDLLL